MTEPTERAASTEGLRALADWLDANPDVPLPYATICAYGVTDRATTLALISSMAPCTIEAGDIASSRNVVREFGPVRYRVWVRAQDVGSQRPVTKTVTEFVVDPDAARLAVGTKPVPA